jgi:hypothetical protein
LRLAKPRGIVALTSALQTRCGRPRSSIVHLRKITEIRNRHLGRSRRSGADVLTIMLAPVWQGMAGMATINMAMATMVTITMLYLHFSTIWLLALLRRSNSETAIENP